MKKLFVLLVLTLLVFGLFADDLMKVTAKQPILRDNVIETRKVANHSQAREISYEFVTQPTSLMENYYDYMPGSYNGTPVRVQADEFGGLYIIFHARETVNVNRRVYYAYVDANGTVTNCSTISTTDLHEGYAGVDVDPVTGVPFVSWHVDFQAPAGELECMFTYDLYYMLVGLWLTPFVVIGDNQPANTPNGTLDEFEWPYVSVGPSPDPDKRRVYVQANNGYSSGDPTENPLIAYADFNSNDLDQQSQLEWDYVTIPIFDGWNQSNPEWIRPFMSFDVSKVDGTVAFFGFNSNDEVYVCYNHNYAEGDWTYSSIPIDIDTWNPQNLDGSYFYLDSNNQPYDLFWGPTYAGHMTTMFHDGSNKLAMQINLALQTREDATGSSYYYPYEIFPYNFEYNFTTDEISYIIAAPEVNENAANPDYEWQYNEMYVPWDTDNDGVVDEYSTTGSVMMYNDWPIYYWYNDVAFHENLAKIAINDDNGWMVHMWSNGLKNKFYNDAGDEEYIDWATIAEIYMVFSANGGQTWTEPLILNSKSDDVNYEPAFAGMMPAYVYCGDKIEDMGDGWGKIHLFFYDDNSFGSYIQSQGSNLGGNLEYASIKVDFSSMPGVGKDHNTVVTNDQDLSNYPNPFNPTTTIKYNVKEAGNVAIEVYNVKGQKINTLVNDYATAGEHTVIWNGTDSNNHSVASGVYFYKMKAGGRYTSTKKMILLK